MLAMRRTVLTLPSASFLRGGAWKSLSQPLVSTSESLSLAIYSMTKDAAGVSLPPLSSSSSLGLVFLKGHGTENFFLAFESAVEEKLGDVKFGRDE